MKSYSDHTVSQDVVSSTITAVDAKQTAQIKNLRRWIAASFAFNVLLTVVLNLRIV